MFVKGSLLFFSVKIFEIEKEIRLLFPLMII